MASSLYYAGFIDVEFLKVESQRALGTRRDARVSVQAAAVVAWLEGIEVQRVTGIPAPQLLRAYWYDGAFDPIDPRYASQRKLFDAIAAVPGIQVRLGHLAERTPRWHHAVRQALRDRC